MPPRFANIGRFLDDLLFGNLQARPAPVRLALLPPRPDQRQQSEGLPRRPAVDLGLRVDITELVTTAYEGALDLRSGHLAAGIQLDGPQQRRPNLVGKQAGRVLAEHRRVQLGAVVGCVQGHAATVRLEVDRVAGSNECGHVGDRVRDAVPVPVARDVQGLVQIARALRIDGDQLDVGPVQVGQPRPGGSLLGRGQDVGGEGVGHLQAGPDGRQSLGQFGRKLIRQADLARRHSARLTGSGAAHSPDRAVRTRIRLHSSQRSTSSSAAAANVPRSAAFTSS